MQPPALLKRWAVARCLASTNNMIVTKHTKNARFPCVCVYYLIPAVFAELATATGFYYSKAKAENRIKLRKLYGPEIYNDAKEI